MTILLIEDGKFQRIANGRALVKAGYDVIHADDGEEGLLAAREKSPDLILLDMMLPKVSGLDVLQTLKGDGLVKHIPVIVLSGLAQANEAKLLKEGEAAFLVKSAESFEDNSTALIQALQSLLTATRARPEQQDLTHGWPNNRQCQPTPSSHGATRTRVGVA
jgi:CheY-like chemotaxis protein